jgi:hypothetical protein
VSTRVNVSARVPWVCRAKLSKAASKAEVWLPERTSLDANNSRDGVASDWNGLDEDDDAQEFDNASQELPCPRHHKVRLGHPSFGEDPLSEPPGAEEVTTKSLLEPIGSAIDSSVCPNHHSTNQQALGEIGSTLQWWIEVEWCYPTPKHFISRCKQ